jgi:hypothetical protein
LWKGKRGLRREVKGEKRTVFEKAVLRREERLEKEKGLKGKRS